jgi:hypothetical protein
MQKSRQRQDSIILVLFTGMASRLSRNKNCVLLVSGEWNGGLLTAVAARRGRNRE